MSYVDITINILGISDGQKLALKHSIEDNLAHINARITYVNGLPDGMMVTIDDGSQMLKADWLMQALVRKADYEADLAALEA